MYDDAAILQLALASNDPKVLRLAHQYLDALSARNAAGSFRRFVGLFWPQVSTSPLQAGWYMDAICDHLQHLPEIKRLLINIPPRHGKSTLVAILFPAWLWITRPSTKFLCSSYSLQLSLRDSIACRSVIESPLYQRHWGKVFTLRPDQNTKSRFNNSKLGFRLSTSTESATLGEGCDVFIGDDLNNVAKVMSKAEREGVLNWWGNVLATRMNPGGLDCQVVIQQRCHEEDISGHILTNDAGNWTKLVLPWHYDPDRKTITAIWFDPRTTPAEPLSDLLTPDKVTELRSGNGLGATGFACQYDQRPAPAEGAVFKREWFQTYSEDDTAYFLGNDQVKKADCWRFAVSDLAISLKNSADWTVVQIWDVTPHRHMILVHQQRARLEGPESIKVFKELYAKYNPALFGVEDVAFQRLMIQMLRQEGVPVKALQTQGQDKLGRSQRVLAMAEGGQVWLPDKEFVPDLLHELLQFPNGAFDDQADCVAWAGILASQRPVRELPRDPTPEEAKAEEQRRLYRAMWSED